MASKSRRPIQRLMRLALVAAVLVLLYDSWRAVVEDSGSNELRVPFRSSRDGEAEVFYDTGAGLRQEDSVKLATTASKKTQELAFPVPRVPLREIRFDPFTGAGDFRIGAPRLVSAIGRVLARFPLTAIKPRNEVGPLRREGDEWIGSTVAGAQDPQLTFALSAPTPVGRVRLPWIEAAVVAVLAVIVSLLAGRRTER
ncbi:MAG TPA: hypothetical protein VG710_07930 [Opitutus sp.]|nr:hypothetical protein [Opitutus sp.]